MNKQVTIGIVAHVDSGKTTLSEAMLYNAGKTRQLGRVDHKNSLLDTNPIEKDRGITVFSKQAVFTHKDTFFTLLDTPGHSDFGAEAERVLSVLDYAILVISASEGVQSHTKTLWKLLESYGVPTFVFINKTDIAHADKNAVLSQIQNELSENCIDFEKDFSGENSEELAMCSDEIMNEYLEGSISDDTIRYAVKSRQVFPCYSGSALKNIGVTELADALSRYTLPYAGKSDFGAKVYKISTDDKGVRLTHIKVTGGTLKVKSTVQYGENEEKINEIRIYTGSKYECVNEVTAGDICALAGPEHTRCGDGMGAELNSGELILESVFSYDVILPPNINSTDAYGAFCRLSQEETKLDAVWNEKTGKISVRLMGEIQTEVIKRIVKERFGFDVEFEKGSVIYKETIAEAVEGVGHYEPLRHYAEVHLILKPGKKGSGITFDTKCSEDELALNWQRLILTHLAEKTHIGVLTGSPITDISITLASGKAHIKHTDGGDFRQATYRAVRHGLANAKSILLEPWYNAIIEVPTQNLGRVLSDLSNMGASFGHQQKSEEISVIDAAAPAEKILSYASDIISFTHGRGNISYSFKGYEPCQNTDEIIEKIGYDFDSDTDNSADSVFCSHGSAQLVKWYDVYENMHLESVMKKKSDDEILSPASVRKASGNISQDEVDRIIKMTYGEKTEKKYVVKNRTSEAKPYKSKSVVLKDEYVLVDGYNIIFAWKELKELADKNIDLARTTLITRLVNYASVRGCNLAVVFDAYKVKGGVGEIEKVDPISVVYTKEAETADSYIEKLSHKLASEYRVRVATSDRLEQMIITGGGALRVYADEFQKEVQNAEESIRQYIK